MRFLEVPYSRSPTGSACQRLCPCSSLAFWQQRQQLGSGDRIESTQLAVLLRIGISNSTSILNYQHANHEQQRLRRLHLDFLDLGTLKASLVEQDFRASVFAAFLILYLQLSKSTCAAPDAFPLISCQTTSLALAKFKSAGNVI